MAPFVTGTRPWVKPPTPSVTESNYRVQQHALKKKNRCLEVSPSIQPKSPTDFFLENGSQEAAQESQKVATNRYDPTGYD